MFANEGMGEVDDHQNFQVGGCMRIIDRERGLTFNRWIFEVFGQPRQEMPKVDDDALTAAANSGRPAFDTTAASTITAWPNMNTGQRDDAFELYTLNASVQRYVERSRVTPPLDDRGPNISKAQGDALKAASLLGQPQFNAEAATTLSPWWNTIPPVDHQTMWLNYKNS